MSEPPAPRSPATIRILVADDVPSIREPLAVALRRAGYEVQTVGDGRTALARLEQGPIDVLLTDVRMPGLTGDRLMEEVSQRSPATAVLLMTAFGTEDLAAKAVRCGAKGYFRKPLMLREVLDRVAEVVRERAERVGLESKVETLEVERKTLSERVGRISERFLDQSRTARVGELTSAIAHEINNPLNVIEGRLRLLLEERAADDDVREHLGAVIPQLERLARLVKTVRGKRVEGREGPIDVGETVRAIIDLVRPMWGLSRIRVELQCEPGLPRVRGDADRLQQVWFNYLKNAYEAIRDAEQGGGRIDVRVLARPGGGVRVEIEDSGPGIPPDRLEAVRAPRLFATSKDYGSGVGLYESHRLITEIGGRVEVESPPGRGATIRIVLPEVARRSPGNYRILVVEDDASLAAVYERYLRRLEYRVDVAPGGLAGLQMGRDQRYDCIVFDIILPGMDGPVMLKRIEERWGAVAHVAVTGDAEGCGITGPVLRKPFRIEALGEAVARALDLSSPDQAQAG